MSGRVGRPSKKLRRLSTDSEGAEEALDWVESRGQTRRADQATSSRNEMSRSRRGAPEVTSRATIFRGPASASPKGQPSLQLKVKTSSNKLRNATRQESSRSTISVNSRDPFVGGEILDGKRSRNVRKSYVLESDSDEEDEEMDDVGDDDAEGEEEEEEEDGEEDDEDMDAEGEEVDDEDADGDVEMDAPPPPPVIKISRAQSGRQSITAKLAAKSDSMTVEQKEAAMGSEDEELSELDSEVGDDVEEEEAMEGNEEDAEGEDEEGGEEEDEEDDDDEELDSDDETPGGGSRASTPDLNKLTKRQRARLEEGGGGHLLALPDEVQVKKHLTAEEHAMRRAEMARRRKNLSEKRNEEEKMETINKLLKKQAPKTQGRRRDAAHIAGDATPQEEKANPLFVRWVSNKDGNRIGVPEEWLEGPIGNLFKASIKAES